MKGPINYWFEIIIFCLNSNKLKLVALYLFFLCRLCVLILLILQSYQEEKQSLLKYLSSLPDQQEESYKSFPGALLAVRYIKEVVSFLFNNLL